MRELSNSRHQRCCGITSKFDLAGHFSAAEPFYYEIGAGEMASRPPSGGRLGPAENSPLRKSPVILSVRAA